MNVIQDEMNKIEDLLTQLESEHIETMAVIVKAAIHLQKGESANALGVLLTELNRHGITDHISKVEYQTE